MSSHHVGKAETKLWIVLETPNSVPPFHDPVDPTGDFFYRKLAVDDMQLALAAVIVNQRLRLIVINVEARTDRLGIVIRAPFEGRASAAVADTFRFWQPEKVIEALAAVRASKATGNAFDELIIAHINDDDRINGLSMAF